MPGAAARVHAVARRATPARGSDPVAETPSVIAVFDNVAMVGEAIQHGGRHLRVAYANGMEAVRTLDIHNEPYWLDLPRGVRVGMAPSPPGSQS